MMIPELKKLFTAILSITIFIGALINITACSFSTSKVQAANLMDRIKANPVSEKNIDEKFIYNTADFSIELFKNSIDDKENSLISPLSAMLALAMTANGADNETLAQMEKALGKDISIEDLNKYLYTYMKKLPNEEKSKLTIANSIWFKENDFMPSKDFLQIIADYYKADIFKAAFDSSTVSDINNWVKSKTNGMIDKILNKIDPEDVMYLINAVAFDAEWETVYEKASVHEDIFTDVYGNRQKVEFMNSEENLYIEEENAVGFVKPYAKNHYSFVAILPDENISVNEYIKTLTGQKFIDLIKNAKITLVRASLPKFKYEYTIKMNETLESLGMTDAFLPDKADFSKLGKSDIGNLYISEVLHKTFISVDELGTKAGAVTSVDITAAGIPVNFKTVKLNRPFIFAIIDNSTNLPIFIGTVLSLK
ncbi:serpin B [Caldanaerobacter subterraneus subsp. tengcongensis MB4]|uniref:Serine protease inhibitor n=1 Tax=Caldanaerobacter subterraneus subsp. tengcongensis (strain DSM 15242 / JCM 11007 / NBRC 100824 / MB4) TaxID=273068 RepID=Q8R9P5_CALS4|nr:serpin family protein [Caldanaerobacter subterraneus]AAM24765.1 serine protease inhibitor [Caldanaerobacter subterraneus subsp. tengcongensis MB4]MCS3915668.1 serpin B [Caldanaerobacter subterraneus subsp. tengcongensis MB4]